MTQPTAGREKRAAKGPVGSFPRVTVLVSTATGWGRGIIKGISAFAQQHGPWLLQVEPEG